MIIEDIEYKLKDGRMALIRSPKDEDIQGMLDCLRIAAGETDYILPYPEECRKHTVESEKADNEAMLICLVEGKVAGNCQITWSNKMKIRHRASIGIVLLSEFWNQGIGTRLFQELIRIAEENPNLMQLELDFIEGNNRARALYEKMGFRVTGVKPDANRLKGGTLLNEYSMIREIRR